MSNRILYVAWSRDSKGLELNVQVDELSIKSSNLRIWFRPREVEVQASIREYRDYLVGKKRYCYIDFNEPISPLKIPRIDLRNQDIEMVSNFELRVIDIELSKYLTIVTPGNFLYNYIILCNDSMGLELSARRNVFYEALDYGIVVYIM